METNAAPLLVVRPNGAPESDAISTETIYQRIHDAKINGGTYRAKKVMESEILRAKKMGMTLRAVNAVEYWDGPGLAAFIKLQQEVGQDLVLWIPGKRVSREEGNGGGEGAAAWSVNGAREVALLAVLVLACYVMAG